MLNGTVHRRGTGTILTTQTVKVMSLTVSETRSVLKMLLSIAYILVGLTRVLYVSIYIIKMTTNILQILAALFKNIMHLIEVVTASSYFVRASPYSPQK